MSSHEQRRAQRVQCSYPCQVRSVGAGQILNISTSGAYVAFPSELSEPPTRSVILFSPDVRGELELTVELQRRAVGRAGGGVPSARVCRCPRSGIGASVWPRTEPGDQENARER